MANKEYVIKVDLNVDSTESSSGQPTSTVQDAEKDTNRTKKKSKDSVSKAVAMQMAKQAANYAVSNYGNLTGDYIAQANIQGAIELGGMIGLAATGPVGAAVAFTGLMLKVASEQTEIYKKNLATSNLRERTGMSFYSGGRL